MIVIFDFKILMFDVKIFNKIEGGFRGESLIINILVFEVKIYFLFEKKWFKVINCYLLMSKMKDCI